MSAKIERLEMEALAPALQQALAARVKRLGYLGEFFKCAGHQPDVLLPFMTMTDALKDALPDKLTEVGALTVAVLMGNEYERHQHERLSEKLGFGRDWVAAVIAAKPDADGPMTPDERAVQRLAIAMVERRGHGVEVRAGRGRRRDRPGPGHVDAVPDRPLRHPRLYRQCPGTRAAGTLDLRGGVMSTDPIWITEAEVVAAMHLGEAIDALEAGLKLEAEGQARSMGKTHAIWGHGHTLHAIGAVLEGAGVVGTKSWAHTEGGATPLLLLWGAENGRLLAVIEAFALGQMRTGGIAGVATRWLARADADELAIIGTGKQAVTQVAAVAAVRPLKRIRVFSPTAENRQAFVAKLAKLLPEIAVREAPSVEAALDGAGIVTLVTRARQPFVTAGMLAPRRAPERGRRDHAGTRGIRPRTCSTGSAPSRSTMSAPSRP